MYGIIKDVDAYELHDGIISKQIFWDFASILSELDGSFNPPLSKRYEGLSDTESVVHFLENRVTVDHTECIYILDKETHRIIGFTTYEITRNEDGIQSLDIGISAIRPTYQGRGLSEHLYDTVEYVAYNRVVNKMTRGTWADNYKQIERYEKRGFILVDTTSRLSIGSRIPRVEYEKWLM